MFLASVKIAISARFLALVRLINIKRNDLDRAGQKVILNFKVITPITGSFIMQKLATRSS
jgi:predicted small secreted protein